MAKCYEVAWCRVARYGGKAHHRGGDKCRQPHDAYSSQSLFHGTHCCSPRKTHVDVAMVHIARAADPSPLTGFLTTEPEHTRTSTMNFREVVLLVPRDVLRFLHPGWTM